MSNYYGLPPCPGCGKDSYLSVWPLDEDLKPDSVQRVDCDYCGYCARIEYWGIRPLEDALRAELAASQAEVERLRGIIRKVEWGKSVHTAWDKYQRCAVCGNKQSSGHDVNCPYYQWEGGAQ